MIRVGGAKYINDGLFGGTVDFRDIISWPFTGNLQSIEFETRAIDNGSGAPGRLDGGIKHRVHERSFLLSKAEF
jgi:hypothetical protein